ncbi:hypothetical protein HY3_01710 [Hyphomonas pacifica]|uniref:Uncharacterized protein n=3 Tax=Hyphomonas pacifica TaxID=1280941 RepID=A0A8B2PLS1_9PROT|nr:hypothetical protein HY11_04990 [Hyphomonas pacifica]RAN34348.1 hypothetical protein HY3_01710 [Hyphomonas pacifica]
MEGWMINLAGWGFALLGVYLIWYTLKQWRRAAKACYPMPFRRRKSYMAGLAFSALFLVSPALVQADSPMDAYQMVANNAAEQG